MSQLRWRISRRDHENENPLVWNGMVVVWCFIAFGMSGCTPILPSYSGYWEADGVTKGQAASDYNVCKTLSATKYAESPTREELITDGVGYWIHVPLLKECMEHKGYRYVGPDSREHPPRPQ